MKVKVNRPFRANGKLYDDLGKVVTLSEETVESLLKINPNMVIKVSEAKETEPVEETEETELIEETVEETEPVEETEVEEEKKPKKTSKRKANSKATE